MAMMTTAGASQHGVAPVGTAAGAVRACCAVIA
jgi:hypothetical protein